MSIFNWGIYGGIGLSFPVGRYITQLNAWDLVNIQSIKTNDNKIEIYFEDGAR